MSLLSAERAPHHHRRHAKVDRPPGAADRARQLRRSAQATTGHVWRVGALPSPVLASTGVPQAEALASLFLVAFCWAPVVVISRDVRVLCAALLTLAVTELLLHVRRVVVGADYVAVRQLGRFHVAHVDHTKHLELRPSERGGVLCLHTDDGRCLRLRRVEVARPRINAALRAFAGTGEHTHDERVEELLAMPAEPHRVRHRYLADLVD